MKTVIITAVFNDDELASSFIEMTSKELHSQDMYVSNQSSPGVTILSAALQSKGMDLPEPVQELDYGPDDEYDDEPYDELDQPAGDFEIAIGGNGSNPEVAKVAAYFPQMEECVLTSIDSKQRIKFKLDESIESSTLFVKSVSSARDSVLFEYCGLEVKFPAEKGKEHAIRASLKFDDVKEIQSCVLYVKESSDIEESYIVFGTDIL